MTYFEDELRIALDDGVKDVLVGERRRQHRHQLALGHHLPDDRPVELPQSLQTQQHDAGVEAATERRPRPVVLPQLAQVPVRLVLHET